MQKISFELELYNFHIDSLGHVNNAVYIQWMDIARSKLLEAIGMPVHKIFQQRVVPILAQTNITYKSPLYLGDRVLVEMWLSELKNASVIMQLPAKMLVWVTPAGFEKFIAEVGKTVNGQITSAPPLSSEDLDKILITAPKYDIKIIPPPSK